MNLREKKAQAIVMRSSDGSKLLNRSILLSSPKAMAFGLCMYLLGHTAQGGQTVFTHHGGCRPEGAPVGGSASLRNSGTGWWHALQADRALRGVLLSWWVETGTGLKGWASGCRAHRGLEPSQG